MMCPHKNIFNTRGGRGGRDIKKYNLILCFIILNKNGSINFKFFTTISHRCRFLRHHVQC